MFQIKFPAEFFRKMKNDPKKEIQSGGKFVSKTGAFSERSKECSKSAEVFLDGKGKLYLMFR